MKKLKLYRDNIVSIVRGKNLVGVYIKYPHFIEGESEFIEMTDVLLAEVSPARADKMVREWNHI